MRDIAFLAFFISFMPAVLRFPQAGAMLWAWVAFFSPDDYMYGFMVNLPLNKLIVIVTAFSMAINPGRKRIYIDGIVLLMLAFVAQGALSAAMSPSLIALNWDLFSKLAKIMALALVLTVLLTSRRRVQGLIIALVAGLMVNGVIEGLKVLASGGGHKVIGMITIGDNNQFALAIVMGLPLTLYLFNTSRNPWVKLALVGTMALSVVSIIGTYSRGGFIGLVVFAGMVLAFNRHKLRNLAIIVAAGFALVQLAPATWFDRINTIEDARSGQDRSFNGRLVAWRVSTAIANDRPFYGAGFHALQDPHVWTTYARAMSDTEAGFGAAGDEFARAAHSIYFEVLGDLGYSGLILFLSMLASGLLACVQIRRMTRNRPDFAWASQLAMMIQVSLVLYMVAGAALSMAYFELLYILLALASVTRRLVRREIARRGLGDGSTAPQRAPWEQTPAAANA